VRAEASAAAALREAARAVGGNATRFIAGGDANTAASRIGRFDALTAPLDRIHRELKREFDPAGIFNPGRLYPDF